MNPSALWASLHHLAAFTLVAALAVEVATFKPPLSAVQARRLQRTDLIFGISAALLLIIGLIRVTWFEKGGRTDLDLPHSHLSVVDQGAASRRRA
jgi:putative membrane protein